MRWDKTNKELTFLGHLDELRKRIILSGLALIIFSLVGYNFSETIAKDLINRAPDMKFIYLSPPELMLCYIRIAVITPLVSYTIFN